MKSYKPYLSLSKTTEAYVLDVALLAGKLQTVESIVQQEVVKGGKTYWGVILTLSTKTQLVNGPEAPIFSISEYIPLERSNQYKTIKCIVRQKPDKGEIGPPQDEESDIDFNDGAI